MRVFISYCHSDDDRYGESRYKWLLFCLLILGLQSFIDMVRIISTADTDGFTHILPTVSHIRIILFGLIYSLIDNLTIVINPPLRLANSLLMLLRSRDKNRLNREAHPLDPWRNVMTDI